MRTTDPSDAARIELLLATKASHATINSLHFFRLYLLLSRRLIADLLISQ